MPTGYTDCIKGGISVRDFILRCSRAMGALIMMREESSDAPIPDRFEPSDYHSKKLNEIEKELASIKSMSNARADSEALNEYNEKVSRNEKCIRENLELREKYTKMLTAISLWKPPTPDHKGLKEFMQKQIYGSIDFDCDTKYYENQTITKLTGQQWKEKRLKTLLKDFSYHNKENLEEIERTESRNAWIKQLKDSLPIN